MSNRLLAVAAEVLHCRPKNPLTNKGDLVTAKLLLGRGP
jgi:hypothetical protein